MYAPAYRHNLKKKEQLSKELKEDVICDKMDCEQSPFKMRPVKSDVNARWVNNTGSSVIKSKARIFV